MNVRKLQIVKFPCQEGTEFDFPDRGIVLVTGDNGVGKSGLDVGFAVGFDVGLVQLPKVATSTVYE